MGGSPRNLISTVVTINHGEKRIWTKWREVDTLAIGMKGGNGRDHALERLLRTWMLDQIPVEDDRIEMKGWMIPSLQGAVPERIAGREIPQGKG
jgi:hypothetical protein